MLPLYISKESDKFQFSLLNYKQKELSNNLFESSLSLFVFSFPMGIALSAVLFLLVEVTGSLAHICACMCGFVCLTRLWLYTLFRLAFSFGSSGLYRFAIQTCAPCLLKQEGFAIAFSRRQKEDGISAVLFLLVEVTGSLAHICACMCGFVCLTRLWSYTLFRLARQVCIALRYKLAHPAC